MAGKKTGKRLLTWVLVLVMALSLLPLNALAASNSVVTARGSNENPIELNYGNHYLDSSGSVTVGVGDTVTDEGVLTVENPHPNSDPTPVYVSTSLSGFYRVGKSNWNYSEDIVKVETLNLGSGKVSIKFTGVSEGTEWVYIDYTGTSTGGACVGRLVYKVTVGNGGSGGTTDPDNKPSKPDVNRFKGSYKAPDGYTYSNVAVFLQCVDQKKGHNAYVSSVAKLSENVGYKLGEVVPNDGTYSYDGELLSKEEYPWRCEMTVYTQPYVDLYNRNYAQERGTHYLTSDTPTEITVQWFYFVGDSEWQEG